MNAFFACGVFTAMAIASAAVHAQAPGAPPVGATTFDFQTEAAGGQPKSFVPVVGNWTIAAEGDNRVLVVDGRAWKEGQAATGIAEQARSLYGERYAEFLDNVKAFAYFPYAVAQGVDDFQNGENAGTAAGYNQNQCSAVGPTPKTDPFSSYSSACNQCNSVAGCGWCSTSSTSISGGSIC